jgi:hypothetical protein
VQSRTDDKAKKPEVEKTDKSDKSEKTKKLRRLHKQLKELNDSIEQPAPGVDSSASRGS